MKRFKYELRFDRNMENPKSIFLKIFGDSPRLRIMDFLITNDDFDYSMTDIADKSGVGYTTLKHFWKKLIKYKVVINTRAVGKAKMYKLNKKNPAIKLFVKLYYTVVENETKILERFL